MSERIRGSYDDALYKSTYTLLYSVLIPSGTPCVESFMRHCSCYGQFLKDQDP